MPPHPSRLAASLKVNWIKPSKEEHGILQQLPSMNILNIMFQCISSGGLKLHLLNRQMRPICFWLLKSHAIISLIFQVHHSLLSLLYLQAYSSYHKQFPPVADFQNTNSKSLIESMGNLILKPSWEKKGLSLQTLPRESIMSQYH